MPTAPTPAASIATVYDYYQDVLGLTSFDGSGAPIDVSIRYNPHEDIYDYFNGYDNAFWDPDAQQIVFGDRGEMDAALDLVGHEYTHAVVSYAVGDGDSPLSGGESGALNEAYADILGSLIENKDGTNRWLIGEDSADGAIRNLADPTSIAGYRDNYADRYTGTDDYGGEHYNSTIFSHAAYEMMTDPATSSISKETWAKVYYHSLYRLSPGATFADGRAAVLDTAGEYGFTAAQLHAVEDAFDDVGIEENAVITV
jgi:bacillolysin